MNPIRLSAVLLLALTAALPADAQTTAPASPPPAAPLPAAPAGTPTPSANSLPREVAVVRWMDKTTARLQTLSIKVGNTETLQGLQVTVRACLERPPEDPPESAAFLDVVERKPGEPTAEVFRGWMFASSPALSAMEHPVYDLWVIDCRTLAEDQEKKGQ